MNNYVNAEITVFQQKMNGYLMLFNYRMMNLCVKAEPASLMPASIVLEDGAAYNIEDVANINKPDDYHFKVTPKNKNNMMPILEAVFAIHPEFEMEEKQEKNAFNEVEHFVIYSMPEVDKERRDLLNETTTSFHKECLARLDLEYASQSASFVSVLASVPAEEAEEAKDTISEIYDKAKENADEMLKAKLTEIEDGYQRYLQQKEDREAQAANEFDFSKGMRPNNPLDE